MGKQPQRWVLGRDRDPQTRDDVGAFKLWRMKLAWRALGLLGPRRLVDRLFPAGTLCYFDVAQHPDVRGYVAMTVDDAFCGQAAPGAAMIDEVREVFAEFDGRATFFVAAANFFDHHHDAVARLVGDGHELANHCVEDRPYHLESRQGFEAHLDAADDILRRFHDPAPRWFRAPHAKVSKVMTQTLADRRMTHVMVDCFANDTAIPDPDFIRRFVVKCATHGSIALVHMPERGLREWLLEALRGTLEGLVDKGLKPVTVSELFGRATAAVRPRP